MKYNIKTIIPFLNKRIQLTYHPEKFEENTTRSQVGSIKQIRKKDIKFQIPGMKNARTIKYKDIIDINEPEKA